MRVADLVPVAREFEGKRVVVEGVFVMAQGVGYFVQDAAEREGRGKAMLVNFPGLEDALLSSVPAYGGGKFSYCDNAKISGMIISSPSDDFPCAINEIEEFIIYKYGDPMSVKI